MVGVPEFLNGPSVARVVLERDRQADPEVDDAAVLDRDVLTQDLGDTEVADGLAGRRHGGLGRSLPRLAAHADDLGHAVHAVSHWVSPPGSFVAEPGGR